MSDTLPIATELVDSFADDRTKGYIGPPSHTLDGMRIIETDDSRIQVHSSPIKPPMILGKESVTPEASTTSSNSRSTIKQSQASMLTIPSNRILIDQPEATTFVSQDQLLRAMSVALLECDIHTSEEAALESLCEKILAISELSNAVAISIDGRGATPIAWARFGTPIPRSEMKFFKTSSVPLAIQQGLVRFAHAETGGPINFRDIHQVGVRTTPWCEYEGWWRSNPWLENSKVFTYYDGTRQEGLAFLVAADSRFYVTDGFLDALYRPLDVASRRTRLSYRAKVSDRLYQSIKSLINAPGATEEKDALAIKIASSFHDVLPQSYCYAALVGAAGTIISQAMVGIAMNHAGGQLDLKDFKARLYADRDLTSRAMSGSAFSDSDGVSRPYRPMDPRTAPQSTTMVDFWIVGDPTLKCYVSFGLAPNRFHWSNFERAQLEEIAETVQLVIRETASSLKQSSILSELEMKATTDQLTHLPNREVFMDRARQALIRSRTTGSRIGIAFLDLNNFKLVNDMYGHEVGDKLLIEVAKRFSEAFRSVDTAARLSGDEFAALLTDVVDEDQAKTICDRVLAAISKTVTIGDLSLDITASIGLAISDPSEVSTPESSIDELLNHADTAMYRAKVSRSTTIELYSDSTEDSEEVSRTLTCVNLAALQVSIDDNSPKLFELSGTERQYFKTLTAAETYGTDTTNVLGDPLRGWTSVERRLLWDRVTSSLGEGSANIAASNSFKTSEQLTRADVEPSGPTRLVVPMITADLSGTTHTAKTISDISKATLTPPSNLILSFDAGDLANASDATNKSLRSLRVTTGIRIMITGETDDLMNLSWLLDVRPEYLHLREDQMSNRSLVDTVGIIGRSLKLTFTYS